MKIYLVGGAVRDSLLNKKPKDRDFLVVGSTPEEMKEKGFIPVGNFFPVFLHPETKEEYALARKEFKRGSGHQGFEFDFNPHVTLEEDLLRRDLTINAIAIDTETQEIVDPFQGRIDLENKTLRHISPHFSEDPLRVLRVARFNSQLPDFKIDNQTKMIMQAIAESGELGTLSPERILEELIKSFATKNPDLFFRVLREVQALEALFPEIHALIDVPAGSLKYHPEGSSFEHTMLVLLNARHQTEKNEILFSCLVHDLGKALTPKENWPKHHGHEHLGVPLVQQMAERLRIPRSWKEFALTFTKHHLKFHQSFEMTPKKIYQFLKDLDVYRRNERFEDFLICAKSDHFGKLNNNYPQELFLKEIFEETKKIHGENFQHEYQGEKLGLKIDEERIKTIQLIKKTQY